MPGMGGGMPLTGISQSYGFKTSRGNRLGRSADMAATTEYYGQMGGPGGGGTTINFAPTLSNIDAPLVEGLSVGGAAGTPTRGGGGGGGGRATGGAGVRGLRQAVATGPGNKVSLAEIKQLAGGRGPNAATNLLTKAEAGGFDLGAGATRWLTNQASRGGGGGRAGGAAGGEEGARETALELAQTRLGKEQNLANLKAAAQSEGKLTVSELKGMLGQGAGLRQTRNLIESEGLTLGNKASDFLNKQLSSAGAREAATEGQESGGNAGEITVPAARIPVGGTLRSSAIPTRVSLMGSPASIAQQAAELGGTKKLTQAEARTALESGASAAQIMRQVKKGNITASKKATAKLTAQRAAARRA
jgi:hypothetical protein